MHGEAAVEVVQLEEAVGVDLVVSWVGVGSA